MVQDQINPKIHIHVGKKNKGMDAKELALGLEFIVCNKITMCWHKCGTTSPLNIDDLNSRKYNSNLLSLGPTLSPIGESMNGCSGVQVS